MIFRRPVTIERQAPGGFVNGLWQPGAIEAVTILASVQPASGRDMERLPEGRRQAGAVRIFTDATLQLEAGAQKADRIVLPQGTYEVAIADEWQNGIMPHNTYLCVRIVKANGELPPATVYEPNVFEMGVFE